LERLKEWKNEDQVVVIGEPKDVEGGKEE